MMFLAGQMVFHKAGKFSGKVLEQEGDTVYIVQPNGVEMEFRSAELTTTPPRQQSQEAVVAERLTRVLTMADITPEHQRVLGIIPQRTMQAVAALYERRAKTRFSALNVAQKLNFIAEVTAVPYRTMKAHSDSPGTLGLMMGRGLSVSLGTAT